MFQIAIIIQINIAYRNIWEKGNETGKSDGRGKSNKAIREERVCEENSVLGRVFRDSCVDSIYKFSYKINFTICPLGHRQERGQSTENVQRGTANAEKRTSPEWSADMLSFIFPPALLTGRKVKLKKET